MLLIAIIVFAAIIVVMGLMVVIFAFLNPWVVAAMFGMILAFLYFYYGKNRKKTRR